MKTKLSKNFMWWMVATISLIATIINTINKSYLIALVMGVCFIIAGKQYLKYRKRGE